MSILLKFRRLACMAIFLLGSVNGISQTNAVKLGIEEIRKTEKLFETDLNTLGVAIAFEKYAAPNAVIKREQDSLVFGPKAIRQYYSSENYKTAKANWSPDFIDISQDGTMAYTYGKYQWKMTDKSGEVHEFSGVFHTVWKKQPDGSWKYVWD